MIASLYFCKYSIVYYWSNRVAPFIFTSSTTDLKYNFESRHEQKHLEQLCWLEMMIYKKINIHITRWKKDCPQRPRVCLSTTTLHKGKLYKNAALRNNSLKLNKIMHLTCNKSSCCNVACFVMQHLCYAMLCNILCWLHHYSNIETTAKIVTRWCFQCLLQDNWRLVVTWENQVKTTLQKI